MILSTADAWHGLFKFGCTQHASCNTCSLMGWTTCEQSCQQQQQQQATPLKVLSSTAAAQQWEQYGGVCASNPTTPRCACSGPPVTSESLEVTCVKPSKQQNLQLSNMRVGMPLQDPIFTLLPYPGDVMDRRMGSTEIPGKWCTAAYVACCTHFLRACVDALSNKAACPTPMQCSCSMADCMANAVPRRAPSFWTRSLFHHSASSSHSNPHRFYGVACSILSRQTHPNTALGIFICT